MLSAWLDALSGFKSGVIFQKFVMPVAGMSAANNARGVRIA